MEYIADNEYFFTGKNNNISQLKLGRIAAAHGAKEMCDSALPPWPCEANFD
ncbi:hypothetical protein [Sphingobium baderi]|uniref:hypothetical protein n=1 Tax=Sphingobium baderi TaxID=1332080 RepID=UPI001F380141|nr:hypothetical protein [Sphingobium baderi]